MFTPYGGGIVWKATASESAKVVVDGLCDIDSNSVRTYKNHLDWPEWIKVIGFPPTNSLNRDEWEN